MRFKTLKQKIAAVTKLLDYGTDTMEVGFEALSKGSVYIHIYYYEGDVIKETKIYELFSFVGEKENQEVYNKVLALLTSQDATEAKYRGSLRVRIKSVCLSNVFNHKSVCISNTFPYLCGINHFCKDD